MKKLILLLFFAVIVASCGNKNETSGDKKEDQKQETKKDNSVQNDVKKEEMSVTQADEDKNKINELGMTPGLPSTFPGDVPQPKNAKTLGSLNSSEGTMVTFESTEKVGDIIAFYKEEMSKNGYKLVEGEESLVSDKGGLVNWKKDNKDVGIMLGYDKDKNITSLVITYK